MNCCAKGHSRLVAFLSRANILLGRLSALFLVIQEALANIHNMRRARQQKSGCAATSKKSCWRSATAEIRRVC
jgi:hypothetical protein